MYLAPLAQGLYWTFYSLDDGIRVQEMLTEITNQKTVPNIFVNRVHVGGCDRTFQVSPPACRPRSVLKSI